MRNSLFKKIKPEYIFISALIVIPAFLFQENVILKWFHVLFFILVSFFAGKRIKILPNLIMMSGITAANLLTPVGEVLFYILKFPVTSGALISGLEKSAMLIGMIYISKTALSGNISMNWKKRNVISDLFFYFEKIMEGQESLSGKSNNSSDNKKDKRRYTPSGLINDLIHKTDKKLLALENISKESVVLKTSADQSLYSKSLSWGFLIVFVSANWTLLLFFR